MNIYSYAQEIPAHLERHYLWDTMQALQDVSGGTYAHHRWYKTRFLGTPNLLLPMPFTDNLVSLIRQIVEATQE